MVKSRIGKALISISVIVFIILNSNLPVMATPNEEVITTLNEEAIENNEEVIANQEKYKELDKIIDETQGKIYRINTEIDKLTELIKKNEDELKVISSDVEESKKEIKKEEENLIEQEEMLTKRLRELYKSGGQNNYILMIITAEGFTDFVSKILIANKMVGLDKEVITDLKEKQEELKDSVDKLEEKSNSITKAKEENEKALNEIEKKKMEQEVLVAQLLEERGKFDGDYLSVSERKLVAHQLKVMKESTLLEELQIVIGQLINIRDKQLKSPTIIEEINQSIIEVTKRVDGLEKYLEEVGTSIKEGTLSGNAIVSYAYQFLGKPYVFGATGPDEFDCSGFTKYVYNKVAEIDITRTTHTQIKQGESIPLSELKLGDLVFTYGVDHVGIYVGGGSYIHAPQPGESIKVSQITSFTEGRRII